MKRILTSAVLLPIGLYAILAAPPWVVLGLATVFATCCFWEFAAIVQAGGIPIRRGLGIAAGLALMAVPGEGFPVILAAALAALVWEFRGGRLADLFPRAALLVFGLVYVYGAWKCAVLIHAFSPKWLLFALGLNWIGDISAYYAGRRFGRHKLAPSISPGKTWEGTVAALALAALAGYFYLGRFLPQTPPWQAVALSAAVNVLGQAGDLAESALKRGAGVKDSGALLPGHGGFLDRFDSSLFTLPAVYFYLRWA
jgi:phosphatidate cytidylyltransferase